MLALKFSNIITKIVITSNKIDMQATNKTTKIGVEVAFRIISGNKLVSIEYNCTIVENGPDDSKW